MSSHQIKITADIFAAHLKCPMKCWLRTTDEPFSGSAYAEWVKKQSHSYRTTGTELLAAQSSNNEFALSPSLSNLESEKWRTASSILVQTQTDNCILESELHAISRVPAAIKGHPDDITPIRFVFTNKLGTLDKLLLGFDAFVLSKSIECSVRVGKIIHGDDGDTQRVNVAAITGTIQKHIEKISALLANPTPPELVLNRHCPECEFLNRCRQQAKETDDLSLLSGMSEKERAQHRSKGIFTVTQLSYTFRPRRTPKRAKNPAKPHHFALQALAIRGRCVYIHGSPILPECKSKVYLDIEGLPDRDFYYLIGALVVSDEGETFHSFWADTKSDEASIFCQFAETISQLPDYRVFHYGDYDAAAIKRVAAVLPKSSQEQFDAILQNTVNVVSFVYPHVYFPTYSNSLKEFAPYVGCNAISQEVTGLDSIIWRTQWEKLSDSQLRMQLIDYNHGDCTALKHLADFITSRISNETETNGEGVAVSRTDEMKLERPYWQLFEPKRYALEDLQEINKSAYFDYQRDKVFFRTHPQFKSIILRSVKSNRTSQSKPNKTIFAEVRNCPDCRSRKLHRDSESAHIVVDLKFTRSGIKKCVTKFVSWLYRCEKCGKRFRSEDRLPNPQKYGHDLSCWCVYQNAVLGVNMAKVRKSLIDVFGLHLLIRHQ